MGSNLVLSGCNSFARVCNVLCASMTYDITHGMLIMSVKVTDSGQKWQFWCGSGSAEGLEASARAQRVCSRITRRGMM